MSAVAKRKAGLPTNFKPQEAKLRDLQADTAAVEQKMKDQAKFVQWWAENVRDRGRPTKKVS